MRHDSHGDTPTAPVLELPIKETLPNESNRGADTLGNTGIKCVVTIAKYPQIRYCK